MKTRSWRFVSCLLLLTAALLAGCSIHPQEDDFVGTRQTQMFGDAGDLKTFNFMPSPGETTSSLWISRQMDIYHSNYQVYSDFDAGGNNFVVLAAIGDWSNLTVKGDYTNDDASTGDSCIKITFNPRPVTTGLFLNGTQRDGISPDPWVITPMAQAIPLLALAQVYLGLDRGIYSNGLTSAERNNLVFSNSVGSLYDYNTDKDGMYTEGNGWMALAHCYLSNVVKGTNVIRGMTNTNTALFGSLYAATKDQLTTGYLDYQNSNWVVYRRPALAPTALSVIAGKKLNPFWIGTSTSNVYGPKEAAPKGYAFLTNQMNTNNFSFYIYKDANSPANRFNHRGYIIDNLYGSVSLIDEQYTNSKYAGLTSARYVITNSNLYQRFGTGVYYQLGVLVNNALVENWGNYTNAGVNLTGATSLTFYAKAAAANTPVQFFSLGVGRDHTTGAVLTNPDTGAPYLYPDSDWMAPTNIVLTTSWTKYTINLTGKNLSYVLGGFGWYTSPNAGGSYEIFIDEVYINYSTTNRPRPIASYVVTNSAYAFDKIMANFAYTYDNALAALAFMAYGDQARAKLVLDFYVDASTNDRYYTDGRLRNAYIAQDKYLPGGWNLSTFSNSPGLPGWWDAVMNTWYEDSYAVGTSADTMAYMMLAMITYYQTYGSTGNQAYLDCAMRLGNWVQNNCSDGSYGYTGGWFGWGEGSGSQTRETAKSTTANSALAAAFQRIYNSTLSIPWYARARGSYEFVVSMWGMGWGGWVWQNGQLNATTGSPNYVPGTNWGYTPNAGVNLSGATKLEFYAKGAVGGEQVKFMMGGIGWSNSMTTNPMASYPDSCSGVSSNITLTTSWTKYTLDLTGKDLSYVLGGFWAVVSATNTNTITIYLDEIQYDKPRLGNARFIRSFDNNQRNTNVANIVLKNTAFVYDDALAIMAFLAVGQNDRARLIADALVAAQNNDRYYTDGRLRNGYAAGEFFTPPGWKSNGKTNTVRMPGWYAVSNSTWYEDSYVVSTTVGNLAWAMLALEAYYQFNGGVQYLEATKKLGAWIYTNAYLDCDGESAANDTYPGFYGGLSGWEPDPVGMLWKSTEHNLDLFAAYTRLYQITGDTTWKNYAAIASNFVYLMWESSSNCFLTGTVGNMPDADDRNYDIIPLDTQVWTHLSLLTMPAQYWNSFNWATNCISTNTVNWLGFDFNGDKDGVWFEGSGQMCTGYMLKGDESNATRILNAFTALGRAPDNGIYASTKDGMTTGFYLQDYDGDGNGDPWLYFKMPALAATSWHVLSEKRVNAFWLGTMDGIMQTNTPGTGCGLYTEYFGMMGCQAFNSSQTNTTIDFNWGAGKPTVTPFPKADCVVLGNDYFSIRWTGQIEPQYSQTYTFKTVSDDGVRLWINDQIVIDKFTNYQSITNTGTITLQAGRKYNIKMEYQENVGNAYVKLLWQSASQAEQVVPSSRLYPDAAHSGFMTEYHNDNNYNPPDFVKTADNPVVNFDWGTAGPLPEMDGDTFIVIWMGWIKPEFTETYTIYLETGEYKYVWFNSNVIISHWSETPSEVSNTVTLTAGQWYPIYFEYYELYGNSFAKLSWSSPSQPKQVIPASRIRH